MFWKLSMTRHQTTKKRAEDSARTARGQREDSARTARGQREDFARTARGRDKNARTHDKRQTNQKETKLAPKSANKGNWTVFCLEKGFEGHLE